jgi:carbonic anhydrase
MVSPFEVIPNIQVGEPDHETLQRQTSFDSTDFRGLQQLHEGNQIFRESLSQGGTIVQQDPGFMIIGCTDNRLSPSAVFNAPDGSIITHNNIGNQYSSEDPSVTAAVSYAVESSQVQHVIVLGHYGCKGAEAAITMPNMVNNLVRKWIKPLAELYSKSRRAEIVQLRDSRMPHREQPNGIKEAPPSSHAGFRALVEENVKRSVRELRDNSFLAKAYSKPSTNDFDVFVHGFVVEETTGEVINLNVSFGPPGKRIPYPPFRALAAAQRFRHNTYL